MEKDDRITEGPGADNCEVGERRCGTIALAGRSNVGKSTLLNRILGAPVAIVTDKPQATRTRVLGIRNVGPSQMLWVDIPGLHRPRSLVNRRMVDTARRAIAEADVVVVMIDATAALSAADAAAADVAAETGRPWLVAVNKIDLVRRAGLLALLGRLAARFPDRDLVPISAQTGENLAELERTVARLLPRGPWLHAGEDFTDQTSRMIVQELVREKVFETTGEEIPYRAAVVVERFEEKTDRDLVVVHATILVERESQKRIVVGRGGAMIGEIGRRARARLEQFFAKRFFLELFVKVAPAWTENPRVLDELGL